MSDEKTDEPDKDRNALSLAKMIVFQCSLEFGIAMVELDARVPGVVVPAEHQTDEKLVLRFGLELQPPIRDFTFGQDGIEATLIFGTRWIPCVVPWTAVRMVWEEAGKGALGIAVPILVEIPVEVESKPELPRAKLSFVPEEPN